MQCPVVIVFPMQGERSRELVAAAKMATDREKGEVASRSAEATQRQREPIERGLRAPKAAGPEHNGQT